MCARFSASRSTSPRAEKSGAFTSAVSCPRTAPISERTSRSSASRSAGPFASSSIAVQATVKAVAAGSVTVDVQGQSLTVPLPGGLTLPASLVGQTVTLDLSLAADDDQGGDRGDDDRGDDDHGGDHGDGGGDG